MPHIESAVIWDASAQPVEIPTPNHRAFTVTVEASDGRKVQLTWYVGGELDGHIGLQGWSNPEDKHIPEISVEVRLQSERVD